MRSGDTRLLGCGSSDRSSGAGQVGSESGMLGSSSALHFSHVPRHGGFKCPHAGHAAVMTGAERNSEGRSDKATERTAARRTRQPDRLLTPRRRICRPDTESAADLEQAKKAHRGRRSGARAAAHFITVAKVPAVHAATSLQVVPERLGVVRTEALVPPDSSLSLHVMQSMHAPAEHFSGEQTVI